ncbi:hypothetical protein SLEP1_g32877 [Rubroshorea leprosula]|uniref:Remorin C-terminal domain-containing protein n=1 Tax=Rubroshorea leprosula TaxID=152421 RepID=A0AAV5KEU5_9ROSI|nr:hypothetical protein SLEP1_g32877 [Rubroshorea leprosula]
MGEEGPKKVEYSAPAEEKDVAQEKSLIPVPEEVTPAPEKSSGSSIDRDAVLAQLATEKRNALVKAWEENEKAKVDNKVYKKTCDIGSRENCKIAYVEADLKKIEEKLEKKKSEYTEKKKNKMAEIHREAEEKRAMVEAKKGEQYHKIEERAEKFRATGYTTKKFLGCFSC